MAPQLQIVSGNQAGQSRDVTGERYLVGRGSDVELTLEDGEASRRHAVLRPQPDGSVVLEDLGSTNGTYVNGQRLTGPVSLRGGERVRIGDTEMTFAADDAGKTRMSDQPAFAAAQPAAGAAAPGPAPAAAAAGGGAAPPTPSRIERIMLRRSVNRAMILAGVAISVAIVVVVLAVAGVFSGSEQTSSSEIVAAVRPSTVDVLISQTGEGVVAGG